VTANAIVGTPNLLFLGAGASKPYGLKLMGEFVQSFRQRYATPVAPATLLEAICGKNEDLEFLIEELDALSTRDYLEDQRSLSAVVGLVGGSGWRWPEFQKLAVEARELLASLKREVYMHYRSIPDPAETDLLARPIELLKDGSHPMVVFTTNYDPAVEDFCARQNFRLTDGFSRDRQMRTEVWNRKNFDKFALPEPGTADALEQSLILFKLHGSAEWFKKQDRIVKSQPTYDNNDPDYHNVMIYPATRKVAIEEPYFTAYDYLEQCLDEAKSCLAIGYSFRDYDALMRFKSAKLSNNHLQIIVLDPKANAVCEYLKGYGIVAYPLQYHFGGDQVPKYLQRISVYLQGKSHAGVEHAQSG